MSSVVSNTLGIPWRPHLFCTEICHLLGLCWMVLLHMCTCQIDMQMLINTINSCPASSCSILDWHQLVLDSISLLILEMCHWHLDHSSLTGLINAQFSHAESKHWWTVSCGLGNKSSCCTTPISQPLLVLNYCCCCRCSNSFMNQSAYATHHGRVSFCTFFNL